MISYPLQDCSLSLSLSIWLVGGQKTTDIADLTINTLELWLVAQKLLKFITESESRMPRELRRIIQQLNDEVRSPPPPASASASAASLLMAVSYACR